MTDLNMARACYKALVYDHPAGLTTPELARVLGTNERNARDAMNSVKSLAASHPHSQHGALILGYDPETKRYVNAQGRDQAERIMRHYHARIMDMAGVLRVQLEGYRSRYGETRSAAAVQQSLFAADQLATTTGWY